MLLAKESKKKKKQKETPVEKRLSKAHMEVPRSGSLPRLSPTEGVGWYGIDDIVLIGLRKNPPLGALCLKGPVRCSGTFPNENPEAALVDRLRLSVCICSGIKVVVVICVFLKSLICSRVCLVGNVSMSSGVRSTDEEENCL